MPNTVIFKWNPAISSYETTRFLNAIAESNPVMDWSVWEHDRVRKGDIFYMLKVDLGQTGIVMRGTITSDPATGPDWASQDREVFYCDFRADIILNPDTLPILGSHELQDNIPNFDWMGGHSGLVLDPHQADILDRMWNVYFKNNLQTFSDRLDFIRRRGYINDQLFIDKQLRTSVLD